MLLISVNWPWSGWPIVQISKKATKLKITFNASRLSMPFLCFIYSQWVKEKWLTSTASVIQSKTNISCSRQETTDDLDDGPPVMLSRLGKRSDYMTRLGKRSDYMTRLGRSYMTRLGKRSADYMTRLGKRPNYMTRLGKRSSNYLTRLGKRSGPISSQPGEDLVRRIIHFDRVIFYLRQITVALILHCFSEAVIKSEERRSPAIYDLMKFGKRSDLIIPRRGYRDWMTRLGWLAQPKIFFQPIY